MLQRQLLPIGSLDTRLPFDQNEQKFYPLGHRFLSQVNCCDFANITVVDILFRSKNSLVEGLYLPTEDFLSKDSTSRTVFPFLGLEQ